VKLGLVCQRHLKHLSLIPYWLKLLDFDFLICYYGKGLYNEIFNKEAMMRKILCFLAFFVLIAFVLYADEDKESVTSPEKERILNFGAGFSYTNNPEFYGGHFEFGINLYKNIFFVKNKFLLRVGGFKTDSFDNTALTFSDKITFGRNAANVTDMYVYMEGGVGFFSNAQNNFSGDTFIYNFGFGGGLELGDFDFGGLYVEVGYIGQKMISNYPLSGVLVQTGWRIYL
jgi:hypothetical protein